MVTRSRAETVLVSLAPSPSRPSARPCRRRSSCAAAGARPPARTPHRAGLETLDRSSFTGTEDKRNISSAARILKQKLICCLQTSFSFFFSFFLFFLHSL